MIIINANKNKTNVIGNKADMSLETIVIAAVCLLVLIVLLVIFASRMGLWNSGIKYCDTVCKETSDECTNSYDGLPTAISGCKDKSGFEVKGTGYCCRGALKPITST